MTATSASEVSPTVQPRILTYTTRAFIGLAGILLVLALFVAIALPYGEWDAMSFGTWSRLIAGHWPHLRFSSVGAAEYQRPLFYFIQGTAWAVLGFHQAVGRLLSLCFSLVLLGSTASLAARGGRRHRALIGALASVVLLLVAGFDRYIAAGLSDIPAAGLVALVAALLLVQRLGRARLPLAAAAAAAAVLAKPSALPALVGLIGAIALGSRSDLRPRLHAAAAVAVGGAAGIAYDALQAAYLHTGLFGFLTSGTDGFYAQLAAADRRRVLLGGSWLGADLHLVLWFSLVYAVARLGLAHRRAVLIALPLSIGWTSLAPHLAGTGSGVASGGLLERGALIALAASLVLSLDAPRWAIPSRLQLSRALVWATPPFVVWALRLVYDVRLLAPAWPPLVLLVTWTFAPAIVGAHRRAAFLPVVPVAAIIVLGTVAADNINGLGSAGWKALRSSTITNAAQMRSLALGGDFATELDSLAHTIRSSDRIETYDRRLSFFYLNQVEIVAPGSCDQMRDGRILVLLESDEVRTLFGRRSTTAYWNACRSPRLTLVDERPGAYAIFVRGAPPVQGGCGAQPSAGLAVEFGRFRTEAAARSLLFRAKAVGFVEARIERIGCTAYRVVETGVPGEAVGRSIVAEAASAHLRARLVGG